MRNPITYILRKWAFVRMGVYEFKYKSEFISSDVHNVLTNFVTLTMLSVEIGAMFAYAYLGGRLHPGWTFALSYVALSILVNYLIVSAVLFPYRKRHYIPQIFNIASCRARKLFSHKNRLVLIYVVGFFWGCLVIFVHLIKWLFPK